MLRICIFSKKLEQFKFSLISMDLMQKVPFLNIDLDAH